MKKEEKKYKITPEQIAELKKKHGEDINVYSVKGLECYLKRPTVIDIDYAQSMSTGGSISYKKNLIDVIWLGGDEEIRSTDKYLMGLISFVAELIEVEVGELGKL